MAEGKLLTVGLAPEQHGDRMALFLQWKQMEEIPVMIDSYNNLGLRAVPLTLLIDESGVIRHQNPSDEVLARFLASPPAEVGSAAPAPRPVTVFPRLDPTGAAFEQELVRLDDAFGHPPTFTNRNSEAAFRMGVAHRKRYDSPEGTPEDFEKAVHYWSGALRKDPSNYIWRRRLQQFGPRLDKPYPFYNWISQARQDIRDRGDLPHPLVVEPSGAETARPGNADPDREQAEPHPDPFHKLPEQDPGHFTPTIVYVPHTDGVTEAFRVFVELEPVADRAKWNDEGGRSTLRPVAPPNWSVTPEVLTFRPVAGRSSRTVEFELRRTSPFDPFVEDRQAPPKLTLQFFLHSCFGTPEVCAYQRLDLPSPIPPR